MFGFFKRLKQRAYLAIIAGAADAARDLGLADDEAGDGEAAAALRDYLSYPAPLSLPPSPDKDAKGDESSNGEPLGHRRKARS